MNTTNPRPIPDDHVVITCDEARRALSVSLRTVQRLVARGELKVVRCGKAVRITRASLEAFVASGGTPK